MASLICTLDRYIADATSLDDDQHHSVVGSSLSGDRLGYRSLAENSRGLPPREPEGIGLAGVNRLSGVRRITE